MPSVPFDLLTIGHSNHPIERFVALLKQVNVAVLVDVRSRPFSRRFPWFSQPRIGERLQQDTIQYVARGDALGGRPSDPALVRDGIADYEAIARTAGFRQAVEEVIATARRQRACIMCAEREPLDCHRFLLVARVLAERGITIGHILADGTIEPHGKTEERLLASARSGADLFAGPAERLAEAYRRRARAIAYRT
jgi:uncharacterized protein (DUF488 family)